jgi:hypothetical protein
MFDSQGNLIRSFSSDDREEPKQRKVAIAERWFPTPPMLQLKPGMHRFVWDLACCEKGPPPRDSGEQEEHVAPRAPRIPPGTYQVRLTVDGKTLTRPLKVVMDPRSKATEEELERQYAVGREMFTELLDVRCALADIHSVQTQLAARSAKGGGQSPDLSSAQARARDQINHILNDAGSPSPGGMGLEVASRNMASALRVVESGDRMAPSQALAVYDEAHRAAKSKIDEWQRVKASTLAELNSSLKGLSEEPISLGEN